MVHTDFKTIVEFCLILEIYKNGITQVRTAVAFEAKGQRLNVWTEGGLLLRSWEMFALIRFI